MSAPLLADTSVWIDHFSGRDAGVTARLDQPRLHIHEFVEGELRLGVIPRGHPGAALLALVPQLPTLPHSQVVRFITRYHLEGSGIGWVDAHILATAAMFRADLWTSDQSLRRVCSRAGVALYDPASPHVS